MTLRYKSDLRINEFRKKLNELIVNTIDDKFINHCKNLYSNQAYNVCGKFENNDFAVWRYDYFLTGMFYSVITGKIENFGDSFIIELKPKFNLFGKFFVLLISLSVGYGILTGIVIQEDNSFKFLIWRLLLGLIIFILFQVVPIFGYLDSQKKTLGLLTEKLKLIKNEC
jgi:hypothetical protein